jgi:hypothetical protein
LTAAQPTARHDLPPPPTTTTTTIAAHAYAGARPLHSPPGQDKPEALRAELEELLRSQGISYSYSKTSKFANFINKTLL